MARPQAPETSGRSLTHATGIVPLSFVPSINSNASAGLLRSTSSIRVTASVVASFPNPALNTQGYVQSICTVIMLICAVIILFATARRCLRVLGSTIPTFEASEA